MNTAYTMLRRIQKQIVSLPRTALYEYIEEGNPFKILISCMLSVRTKDSVTLPVSKVLFRRADTPAACAALPLKTIEKMIHPVGFYRTKARAIKNTSSEITHTHKGRVPRTRQELLALTGVGPKTANLVLGCAYNIPALCVDTHVHSVSNRVGWVRTTTPAQTEQALMRVFAKRFWISLNDALVRFGQHICVPVSPRCTACAVSLLCPKKGVLRSR